MMDNFLQYSAMLQWNVNGLRSKRAGFQKLVALHAFPVLCLTEDGVGSDYCFANYVDYASSRSAGISRAIA